MDVVCRMEAASAREMEVSVEFLKRSYTDGEIEDVGEILYSSGFRSDGKWEHSDMILKLTEEYVSEGAVPGTYLVREMRSGSYYTDYEYTDPYIEEVEVYYESVPKLLWRKKQ